MDVSVGFLSCYCVHILQMRIAVGFLQILSNKLINIDP